MVKENLEELKIKLEYEKKILLEIPNKDRDWTEYLRLYKSIKYKENKEFKEKEQQRSRNYYNKKHIILNI